MPSLITHQIFSKQLYQLLDNKQKERIDLNTLEVFSQSHDLLYYSKNLNKQQNKFNKDFGYYTHISNTQSFIINIIRNIKKLHLENDQQVIAYLYGTVAHYVLDSTTHPYIYYKTGKYQKSKPESYKYRGLHNQMEKAIDIYLYEKYYQKNINKLNIKKEIVPNITMNCNLIQLINIVYQQTYNKPNIAQEIIKGYKVMRNFFPKFTEDFFKIKQPIYNTLSTIIHHNKIIMGSYSFNNRNNNQTYLNQENNTWYHPVTNQESNESIIDLMNKSLSITINIINEINKVLYEEKDIKELLNIIPNISYLTGLEIGKNKPLQYFEQ